MRALVSRCDGTVEDGEVSVLVWWGMAAIAAGDRAWGERMALKLAEERMLHPPQPTPDGYGHVLRIGAELLNGTR